MGLIYFLLFMVVFWTVVVLVSSFLPEHQVEQGDL